MSTKVRLYYGNAAYIHLKNSKYYLRVTYLRVIFRNFVPNTWNMANDNKGLTPMMRQFFEMKSKHPEALLLFRCGDFYETYCEDAIEASKVLGITLTRRNNGGSAGGAEMAGFPHHALDTYLPKLIRAGKRVAVCSGCGDGRQRLELQGEQLPRCRPLR